MAEPAKRLSFADDPARVFPSLDALMAEMAASGRTGARASAAEIIDPGLWAGFERQLEAALGLRISALPPAALEAETRRIITATSAALATRGKAADATAAYAACIATIDDARASGANLTTAAAMAAHIHRAVAWYSAWHLVGARAALRDMETLLGMRSGGYERPPAASPIPPPPPVKPRPVAAAPEVPPASPSVVNQAWAALADGVDRFRAGMAQAQEAAQAIARETAKARKERLQQEAAARQEQAGRMREAPTARGPASSGMRVLDGPRLRSPVFGTWLMLVLLSWVALIWGALLAIPVVGPFGLLGAMMGGFIMVPLWGTFWGFVGMGAAKASTLRQMGFQEADPLTPLAQTAARLASRLDLPPPRIGTIPAFNAFAMGTDHRHATVAIGQPLMLHLTPDEVAAVIGHELGHVASGDMRKMMLMRTFQNAGVWFMMAQGLRQFMRWVICWAAELAILAFSRRREYWADAIGAALTSKEAMIGALRKLEDAPAPTVAERTHARFMFRGATLSTHPSVADRIAALEAETYLRRLPVKG